MSKVKVTRPINAVRDNESERILVTQRRESESVFHLINNKTIRRSGNYNFLKIALLNLTYRFSEIIVLSLIELMHSISLQCYNLNIN